jgi:hypothetical protein
MSDGKLHYTITVWAGSDMYTQMRVPSTMREDAQQEYDFVSQALRPRMEEDFGTGVELVRRNQAEYDINVDKVPVSE